MTTITGRKLEMAGRNGEVLMVAMVGHAGRTGRTGAKIHNASVEIDLRTGKMWVAHTLCGGNLRGNLITGATGLRATCKNCKSDINDEMQAWQLVQRADGSFELVEGGR